MKAMKNGTTVLGTQKDIKFVVVYVLKKRHLESRKVQASPIRNGDLKSPDYAEWLGGCF